MSDLRAALERINEWCCYATEEDTSARLMALQQIGQTARAALAAPAQDGEAPVADAEVPVLMRALRHAWVGEHKVAADYVTLAADRLEQSMPTTAKAIRSMLAALRDGTPELTLHPLAAPLSPKPPMPLTEHEKVKRIAAIIDLVREYGGARSYAAQHPSVPNATKYRDDVLAEIERCLSLSIDTLGITPDQEG